MSQQLESVDILFYHKGIPVECCKASYLGLLGIGVFTEPEKFPLHTHLELEITNTQTLEQCRRTAVVTSHSDHEVGLTFMKNGETELREFGRLFAGLLDHDESTHQ